MFKDSGRGFFLRRSWLGGLGIFTLEVFAQLKQTTTTKGFQKSAMLLRALSRRNGTWMPWSW